MDEDTNSLLSVVQEVVNYNPNDENSTAEEHLNPYLEDPSSIPIFFKLYLATELPKIRKTCLIYSFRVIEKFQKNFDEDSQNEIRNFILQIIEMPIAADNIENVAQLAELAYKFGAGKWPELLQFLLENVDSHTQIVASVFEKIAPFLHSGFFDATIEQYAAIVTKFLHSTQPSIQASGLALFSAWISHIDPEDEDSDATDALYDSEETYNTINQIMVNSVNNSYKSNTFGSIWSSMADISGSRKVRQSYLSMLMGTAFELASNESLDANSRMLIITAVVNGIEALTSEDIQQILTIVIDIDASMIAEEEALPMTHATIYESILNSNEHSEIYPILQSQLFDALNSESPQHVAAAMLVLKVVLETAPECAQADMEAIIECLRGAFGSDSELLVQAAAEVLISFGAAFSSVNVHTIELLQLVFPFLTAEISVGTRQSCYQAALSLCHTLDCKFPGMFSSVAEIHDSVDENDRENYFALLAYSIDRDDTLNDENVESIIEFVTTAFSTEDPSVIASTMPIAEALMRFDADMLSRINEIYGESIGTLLEFENDDVVRSTIHLLNVLVDLYKGTELDIVLPHIPAILALARLREGRESVTSYAYEMLAALLHYAGVEGGNEDVAGLWPEYIELLKEGLDTATYVLTTLDCIRKVASNLDEESRLFFFNKLVEMSNESVAVEDVRKAIFDVAKLVKNAESNLDHIVKEGSQLLQNTIEGKIQLLGDVPLLERDTTTIFPSVCQLIGALCDKEAPIGQSICEFLMSWLQRESPLDKCNAIGALSDVILAGSVEESAVSEIAGAVVAEIDGAQDPTVKENIVHILNVLVTQDQSYADLAMNALPALRQWWTEALENRSGYTETLINLGALFLVLGILRPDFPESALVSIFGEFPHEDSDTMGAFCGNLLFLLQSGRPMGAELTRAIALGLGRLLGYDAAHLERMGLEEEMLDDVKAAFRDIVGRDKGAVPVIMEACSGNRSRAQRIEAALA